MCNPQNEEEKKPDSPNRTEENVERPKSSSNRKSTSADDVEDCNVAEAEEIHDRIGFQHTHKLVEKLATGNQVEHINSRINFGISA